MENAANELLAKTTTKAHFDLVAMLHSSIWYFLRWPFYLKVDIRSNPVLETLVEPDSRKEAKSKLTITGHYQSAQCATDAYNRSAPEDSPLLPILEPKTDEGRISNAGWRKGHPAEGRCPYFHRLPPCCCFWGC